jgi:hypothetical protein
MVIAAAEPAEVRQLLIIRSLVLAVSNSPVLSSTYGASAELAFRGVPQNVPCENLRRNAHNNKGWALSTARLRICRAFAWHVPDFGVSSVFQNPLPAFRRLYWNARLVTARGTAAGKTMAGCGLRLKPSLNSSSRKCHLRRRVWGIDTVARKPECDANVTPPS